MKKDVNDMAEAVQADPGLLLQGVPFPAADGAAAAADDAKDRPLQPLGHYAPGAWPVFEARERSDAFVPWPANWGNLERLVPRGLLPGLHILVGGTGQGKTQLALQLAVAAARPEPGREPVPVLYVALEADAGFADLVARVADMSGHGQAIGGWSGLYRGEAGDKLPAVRRAADPFIHSLRLVPERGPLMVDGLRVLCERFAAEHKPKDGRPALVVVDYLQRVDVGTEDRRTAMGRLSGALRKVSTEQGLAILALSSTAREHYGTLLVELERKDNRLALHDMTGVRQWMPGTYSPARLVGLGKEAGELEYDADTVLTIVSGKVDGGPEAAHWVAVSKQRAGREGWAPMRFHWTSAGMHWEDREDEPRAPKAGRQASAGRGKKATGAGGGSTDPMGFNVSEA